MAFFELYEHAMRLDGILTGKSESETAHNVRNQAPVLASAADFVRTRSVYYLSDSGYSRFYMTEEGEIFLTSNSRDEVKKVWATPEAAEAAEAFRSAVMGLVEKAAAKESVGMLNAARGVVPGR